jgi:hemerythrin-like domain-containing protein
MQLLARIPNFDEPIDALEICHENILKRMDTMAALAGRIEERGTEALKDDREIWRELFSFITHNIANHSRDEEEGLFPLLREPLGAMIDELERDHGWAEETERYLIDAFEKMTDANIPAASDLKVFAERASSLAAFYRRHIEQENGVIFPAARTHLTEENLRRLGDLMRANRKLG